MTNRPQTIQIFLPDGNPTSIKIADLTNRLIVGVLIPRNKLIECGIRPEIRKYGIYFLFGINEDKAKPIAYIGETDDCFERLKSHNRNKEFWNYAVAITSKSDIFTKSHVKFLEYICIKMAKEIGRYDLENLTAPPKEHISESMEADLLDNFETIKVLLSTLGFPILEEIRNTTKTKKEVLYCKGKNAIAEGELTDDGFVVLKGSKANFEETKTAGNWVIGMRKKLKDDNILIQENNIYIFNEDFIFGSPSSAAAAVLGRRANGWTEWRNSEGKTIDEIYRIENLDDNI
ncbi:GIY-YIG nuclease family protein [Flavobacterium sp. NRK1]|uniref:GIY-YIG nuclease family protein n=1 Tax=Flavobacterium sp. NRK1 TaxID=2954929 RepID=UPI0020939D09|nr:GIY-YIG nuclease family protein [Flavobacterium sp. NRK1]MCO6149626.1 GIY-YIG nuclease family protein [Flavobacterium sp. NRK1]